LLKCGFDRAFRNRQSCPNLLIALAFEYAAQDLALALAEISLANATLRLCYGLCQFTNTSRIDPRLSLLNLAARFDKQQRRAVLQKPPSRAFVQHRGGVGRSHACRHKQNARFRVEGSGMRQEIRSSLCAQVEIE